MFNIQIQLEPVTDAMRGEILLQLREDVEHNTECLTDIEERVRRLETGNIGDRFKNKTTKQDQSTKLEVYL